MPKPASSFFVVKYGAGRNGLKTSIQPKSQLIIYPKRSFSNWVYLVFLSIIYIKGQTVQFLMLPKPEFALTHSQVCQNLKPRNQSFGSKRKKKKV